MPTSDWCTWKFASEGALPGFRKVRMRARRYCALATAPNSSGVAATPNSKKWPMRAPAANSSVPARIATNRAMERFGSRKMRPITGPRMTRKGSRPRWKVRICSPFLAASIAVHTTTANLASSDGCTVTTPRFTQRRAPLSTGATPCVNGSSGNSSSRLTTPSVGQAQRCQWW